jgi:hypothetical protein
MTGIASLLTTGQWRVRFGAPGSPTPTGPYIGSAILLLVVSRAANWGKTHIRLGQWAAIPHEFSVCEGRWDRNRTCNLRCWSSPRFVRQCSCVSTDAESYWLMPSGMSSCVRLCRPGLLSELLSNSKRFYGKSRGLPLAACATSTITDAGHTGMPTSRLSGVSGGNLPLRANATSARQ